MLGSKEVHTDWTICQLGDWAIERFANLPICRLGDWAINLAKVVYNWQMSKFIDLTIWRFANLPIWRFDDLPIGRFDDLPIGRLDGKAGRAERAGKAGRIGRAGSFGHPSLILRSSFGDGKGKVYLTYS